MLLAWLATAWGGAAWALLAAARAGRRGGGSWRSPAGRCTRRRRQARGCAAAVRAAAAGAERGQCWPYLRRAAWLRCGRCAFVAATLPRGLLRALYAAPESPHWLLRAGRRADAARALRRLRGSGPAQEELDAELDAIEAFACAESAEGAPSGAYGEMRALFVDAAVRRALWIVLGMVGLQCMCGYTAFLAYSTVIFQKSGDALDANHSGIVVGVILLVMCLISPVVVDRAGRRFCLLVSCSVAAVALLIEGGYFYAAERQLALADALYWLPVVALVAFFIAFTLGLGPLPTTVAGE
ncbi:Sugar transporter, partial [Gryllus bimaculatus]